jgi:hypothetical protein
VVFQDGVLHVSHGNNIPIHILPILVEVVMKGMDSVSGTTRRGGEHIVSTTIKNRGIPVLVTGHNHMWKCAEFMISIGPYLEVR